MSIITLKEGILPSNLKFVGTCSYCRGKYSWSLSDSETLTQERAFASITCPTANCGRKVTGVPVAVLDTPDNQS